MSNRIFRALLSGIPWDQVVRGLDLQERARGIGDGRIRGYRYTVVQRGDEILIVLPDYQPRDECLEEAKRILSRLAPRAEIKTVAMGYASSHCNHCLKPVPLPYRCYRCGGWYCEEHRLPERHNCPGEKGKEEVGRVGESTKPKREKEKREILVAEVPCG